MQPGAPDERSALRAELGARPAPSLRPASLVSADPLRPLPGELLAKTEIRGRAGYDPTGPDHPRRDRWQQLVFGWLALAAVAGVILIVAVVTDHSLLADIAAAALAAGVLGAAGAWRWIQADPLRIGPAQRRALTAASSWQSRQAWTGALASGPERALVGVAVEVAAQIASSPAWRSGYLDAHRLTLDLTVELDAVDAHAFDLATARQAGGAERDLDAAFDSCVDRVLALRRYAQGLAELSGQIAEADTQIHAAAPIGQLRGDAEGGNFAATGIQHLTDELAVISASVEATAAQLRKERD